MKVIGIMGGIGAGKTTVVSLIQLFKNTLVISADEVGHKLLYKGQAAYEPVIKAFGTDILSCQGEIIRKRLGEIVFRDPQKLHQLNQITHPLIYEEIKRQIDKCQEEELVELILIDAALLIEIGLVKLTDKVIAVYAEDEVRMARIGEREGLSKKEILERFKAQKKWEEFTKVADAVIDNSFSLQETKQQIKNLLECL